jgi:hypothetical protein
MACFALRQNVAFRRRQRIIRRRKFALAQTLIAAQHVL